MAKFQSSAREGSFSNNQLVVPDEVRKLENAANRRLQGMNAHQAFLQRNQEIFLQSQKLSQSLRNESLRTNAQIESEAARVQEQSRAELYQRELALEEARNKSKVDTFGLLANFSKTALDITTGILEQNKNNQLKAINQIAFKQGFDFQDLVNAQSIDSDITKAEWQRTNLVKDYLAAGKSQEFIDVMYQHLIQGGGYRNYIENSNVLTATAANNSRALVALAQDSSIAPEDRRKALAALESQQRAELELDGRIPSSKILEQAYNPTIRESLRRAESVINQDSTALLAEETERDRAAILNKVAFEGGGFNPTNALQIISNDPRPNAMKESVEILLANGLDQSQIRALMDAPFEKDGQTVTLKTGGYTDAMARLQTAYRQAGATAREQLAAEAQAKAIELQLFQEQRAEELANDQDGLTDADVRSIIQESDELFGIGRSREGDTFLKRNTVEERLKPILIDELEQLRLEGNLSVRELDRRLLPMDIRNTFLADARAQDAVRNSDEYKNIDKYLRTRIEDALAESIELKFIDGKLQGDSANWYVARQVQKYRKKYLQMVLVDPENAMRLVGDQAATDSREELGKPGAVSGRRITAYDTAMEESRVKQLEIQRKITELLTARQKGDPNNWISIIGEPTLIEASEQLQKNGTSEIFSQIGISLGLTPTEVQLKVAEVSDNIEPIDVPPTYLEMLNNLTPAQRFSFTSNQAGLRQRLRALREITEANSDEPSPIPVRPAFQPSDGLSRSQTGALTYQGNEEIYRTTGDAFEAAGFQVAEHADFGGVAPVHSPQGYHPHNEAFDITHQTGDYDTSIEKTRRLKEVVRSLDLFAEVIGPGDGDPDHETHLHLGGLMRPITEEDIRLIKSVN